MKWVLWILLILTLCAIVAGLAVLVTMGFMPRPRVVGQPPAVATVQLATFTPRPTRAARATLTATRVAKAAPAITASPSALPSTVAPAATSTPPLGTATPAARRAATLTATAMPTVAATSVVTPTEAATVAPSEAPSKVATPSEVPTQVATPSEVPTEAETQPAEAPAEAGTPGPTASPYPIRPGWTDHTAADFDLALPERWNAVDVSKEGIQGILDRLSEIDNTWAENQAEMYNAENLQETLQFWAMDSRALGASHATVTVVTRELTQTTTLRELAPQIAATLRESRMQILSTRYGLEINGLEAARMTVRGRMDPVTVQEYVYVYLRENKAWVVTYAVDWRYWGSFEPMFASSARSFRAD